MLINNLKPSQVQPLVINYNLCIHVMFYAFDFSGIYLGLSLYAVGKLSIWDELTSATNVRKRKEHKSIVMCLFTRKYG